MRRSQKDQEEEETPLAERQERMKTQKRLAAMRALAAAPETAPEVKAFFALFFDNDDAELRALERDLWFEAWVKVARRAWKEFDATDEYGVDYNRAGAELLRVMAKCCDVLALCGGTIHEPPPRMVLPKPGRGRPRATDRVLVTACMRYLRHEGTGFNHMRGKFLPTEHRIWSLEELQDLAYQMGFSDVNAFRSSQTPADRLATAQEAQDPNSGLHAFVEMSMQHLEVLWRLPPGSMRTTDSPRDLEESIRAMRAHERANRAPIEMSIDWNYYTTATELLSVLHGYPAGSDLIGRPRTSVGTVLMREMAKNVREYRAAVEAGEVTPRTDIRIADPDEPT